VKKNPATQPQPKLARTKQIFIQAKIQTSPTSQGNKIQKKTGKKFSSVIFCFLFSQSSFCFSLFYLSPPIFGLFD
jgi:hypothetical protein